jgi:hypothetical protein
MGEIDRGYLARDLARDFVGKNYPNVAKPTAPEILPGTLNRDSPDST